MSPDTPGNSTPAPNTRRDLMNLVAHNPVPALVISRDGDILAFNLQAEKLVGYSKERFRDFRSMLTKLFPDNTYQDFVSSNFQKLLDGSNLENAIYMVTCRNRKEKIVEFRFMIVEEGFLIQLIDLTETVRVQEEMEEYGANLEKYLAQRTEELTQTIQQLQHEIRQRKVAEDALRTSEERYRKTIDAMYDWIHVMDRNMRIVLNNRSFSEVLRKISENTPEVRGSMLLEVCPFLPDSVLEEYRQVFDTGEPLETEEATMTGIQEVWTETRKLPMFDSEGNVASIITIMRDITERKDSERRLREAHDLLEERIAERTQELAEINMKLQEEIRERNRMEQELLKAQKLESVGLLAGGVAHDFNNILMAIAGYVAVGKWKSKDRNDVFVLLEKAEKACHKAKSLTQQLLTFSKGGSPVKETVSVEQLLKDSAAFTLRGTPIDCRIRIDGPLWPVDVDENQINQVINNLMINAIQASPDNEPIDLDAANDTLKRPDHLGRPAGDYVRISIRDRGEGIPAENMDKIFDPYFTTKPEGTGLGLAVSYSIVKKHNGYIQCRSTFGQGSEFTIFLPASRHTMIQKPRSDGELVRGRGHILVMDDEAIVRESTKFILLEMGYDVTVTANGEEAIAEYRSSVERDEPYDLLILDLTVRGGMGGAEALSLLKQEFPAIKAIVSSGYSNNPVLTQYSNHGFQGLIIKPYRMEDLSQVIRKVLTLQPE